MTSAADTILTIKAAISGVCGPKLSQIARAHSYVDENGEDISLILTGLNAICGGIFLQKAGLSVAITQAETDIINAALVNAGEPSPTDIVLKKKVGIADLSTTAQDLSGAVNEHDSEIGVLSALYSTNKDSLVDSINEVITGGGHDADVYIPIGTLGSFYSCTSLADTSPTLIASGADTIAEMLREQKKCTNWAFLIEFTTVNSKITVDNSDDSVYVSLSSVGGCFNAVGGLQTLPTLVNTEFSNKAYIPAIEVICSNSVCSTVESYADFGYNTFTIPSLEVSCVNNICSTSAIMVVSNPNNYTIYIPSLTVGFISPTAGSLSALCMYELDH